jgi:hypothetical protein
MTTLTILLHCSSNTWPEKKVFQSPTIHPQLLKQNSEASYSHGPKIHPLLLWVYTLAITTCLSNATASADIPKIHQNKANLMLFSTICSMLASP